MPVPAAGFTFAHGWFNHYYTRSLEEFDAKNARGSAVRARSKGRRYTAVPKGVHDVLNLFLLRSVRARLRRMEDAARSLAVREGLLGCLCVCVVIEEKRKSESEKLQVVSFDPSPATRSRSPPAD